MSLTSSPTEQALRPTTAALSLSHVTVRLGDRVALQDISVDVPEGAFVGLLGPNGSGKSTLLRAVLGILPLAAGEVRIEGKEPGAARDLVSYLPQRQKVDLETPLRAWEVVMMGRIRHIGWFGRPRSEDRDAVAWALEKVAIADRADSPIGQLSFGQQQRVFLARALAQEGQILLLDEPMNGVDQATQDLFVELLEGFHKDGRTIVMATHDLNMAACICDTVCIVNRRLVAFGSVEEAFKPGILREAYGAHLHFVEVPAHGHAEVLEDVHHHDDGTPPARPPADPDHKHVHV